MVLVDARDRMGGVDHRYFFLKCVINHPAVPAGPADGERGKIAQRASPEDEIVDAVYAVKFAFLLGPVF